MEVMDGVDDAMKVVGEVKDAVVDAAATEA